jgi:hypothetical protein
MWSQGALPVFDGLVRSLFSADGPKLLKGGVVFALFILAGALLHRSVRAHFWLGIAICVGTLAMTTVLNEHEVWAVVRFGRLLVIPIAVFGIEGLGFPSHWALRVFTVAFAAGVVTNLGFAAYTVASAGLTEVP